MWTRFTEQVNSFHPKRNDEVCAGGICMSQDQRGLHFGTFATEAMTTRRRKRGIAHAPLGTPEHHSVRVCSRGSPSPLELLGMLQESWLAGWLAGECEITTGGRCVMSSVVEGIGGEEGESKNIQKVRS